MSARCSSYRDEPADPKSGIALLVETEGGTRSALLVDAIQGQRQVVIKSLEANYRPCPDGIAAATILGDGRVALILDVDAVVSGSRNDQNVDFLSRTGRVNSDGKQELNPKRARASSSPSCIGSQEFCVDIMSVREIRGWTPATPLPHSPGFVRGVINLRGAVLSIVDLAARLGLKPTEPPPATSSSWRRSATRWSAFWSTPCRTS